MSNFQITPPRESLRQCLKNAYRREQMCEHTDSLPAEMRTALDRLAQAEQHSESRQEE